MPGTNLTREEARRRADLLDVDSYDVELDLSPASTTTFRSTTTLRFRCRQPGAETFADLVGAQVHELSLNGSPLDPAEVYADHRLRLSDLQPENELRVVADMRSVVGKRHTAVPSPLSSGVGVGALETTFQCDGAVTVNVNTDFRSGCSKVA